MAALREGALRFRAVAVFRAVPERRPELTTDDDATRSSAGRPAPTSGTAEIYAALFEKTLLRIFGFEVAVGVLRGAIIIVIVIVVHPPRQMVCLCLSE